MKTTLNRLNLLVAVIFAVLCIEAQARSIAITPEDCMEISSLSDDAFVFVYPTITATPGCGYVRLSYQPVQLPQETLLFWQISATGTTVSAANGNVYYDVVPTGGAKTYYLRLVSTVTNVWDTDFTSITISSIANAGADMQVCAGDELQLGDAPQAGYTYSWNASPSSQLSTLSATNVSNPTARPIVSTTFTLTVTATGCSAVITDQSIISIVTEATPGTFAPTSTENYIAITKMRVPGSNPVAPGDAEKTITYMDGLARPKQVISALSSPMGLDVIQPITYDAYGRQAIKYLPFTSGAHGGFRSYVVEPSTNRFICTAYPFYAQGSDNKIADDVAPYSRTVFEASPLNRVSKQGAPGSAWQPDTNNSYTSADHTTKFSYETNINSEVLLWTYDYTSELVNASTGTTPVYYAKNELLKTKRKDEQQNEIIEFKDLDKRLILKRVQESANNYADTYYIYDDFGSLVCILPPEATKAITKSPSDYFGKTNLQKLDFLKKMAFRYSYDEKKRAIMKQVPGSEPTYMVYDQRDRLVLTQDGNQRIVNKWLFTKFDTLNRPVATGFYLPGSTLDQEAMRTQLEAFYAGITPANKRAWCETLTTTAGNVHGYGNHTFPDVSNPDDYLTVTYYDNYRFKPLFNSTTFDYTQAELQAQENTPGQWQAEFARVNGQITGTKTRVLNSTTWLRATRYYDDHNRLIQSITEDTKGYEIFTNVYNFTGNILRSKTSYVVNSISTPIERRIVYDHRGRVLEVWHGVNNQAMLAIATNEYNELGQLVTKKLHRGGQQMTADPAVGQPGTSYDDEIVASQYNGETAIIANTSILLTPGFTVPSGSNLSVHIGYSAADAADYNANVNSTSRQIVDYRYNIRGWMDEINDVSASDGDLFSLDLRYQNPSSNGGVAQYNGNISEAIWINADGQKQSYGYTYDKMNRIVDANYYNIANPAQNGHYDEWVGDVSRPAYDLNGNILNLFRNGKTGAATFGLMDDLSYSYANGGNQLTAVSDAVNTTTAENGFKEGVEGSLDYAYDAIGNITSDANKGITDITYNHLNLPEKISKSVSEYIVYTYDANGKKLAQQVFGSQAKKTDYVGEMVYENDALQFILHDEGRVVMAGGSPEYQYHLKDHLGDVRVTFTGKSEVEKATATMETAKTQAEAGEFLYYTEAVKVNSPLFDHTNAGATFYSTRLNGSANERSGLAKSLSVKTGDTVKTRVFAKYLDPVASNWTPALNSFITSIATGTAPGGTFIDGGAAGSTGGVTPPFGTVLAKGSETGSAPKAYLNYLIFDLNYNFVDGGFVRMTEYAREYGQDGPHEELAADLVIRQAGYVYIYLSNDNVALGGSALEVYFDDFHVEHIKSAVVSSQDYYPFGLTFNSYQKENSPGNNYQYNGKELQDELDLGWLDYGARMYMSDIGRWGVIDPHSDNSRRWSPYNYAMDNPLRFIDPDGMDGTPAVSPSDGDKTVYTGEEAVSIFTQLQMEEQSRIDRINKEKANEEEAKTGPPGEKNPGNKKKKESASGKVLAGTFVLVGGLAADDITVVGVGDDVAIPPVLVGGLLLAGGLYLIEWYYSADEVDLEESAERNPAQDKPLTKGDIEKLKRNGWDHRDKGDHGGQTDLWKDKAGNVYQKPKNGSGSGEPIGVNLNDLE